MNDISPDDFGDVTDLQRAIGLVDNAGNFNEQWLANPEDHLTTILANPGQRRALLDFVASVQGGEIERDPDGRQWIELFAETIEDGLRIAFFIVVDDQPPAEVHLFLGVRFITEQPLIASTSSLMFPLFRAGKQNAGSPSAGGPELIGHPGGVIAVTNDITITDTPAPPGEAGLKAVGLRLAVPTDGSDGDPEIGLSLSGLQLPGETTPRDLVLSMTDPDAIQDAGLELLLGLVQAQAGDGAGSEIRALARLLGLGADAVIPDLPVEDLFARGIEALTDWLAAALGTEASRSAWLSALADLLGNGAASDADGVTLPIGGGNLLISLKAEPGTAGRPVITFAIAFGFSETASGREVRFASDLARLDLGSGEAIAVPSLRTEARFDLTGINLSGGDISASELVIGFGLDRARRPLLVIELLDVAIFETVHARLDLTNPDAIAASAAAVVTEALNDLLGNLGPTANLIAVAFGWSAPAGAATGYPTIDPISFLADPLGRMRTHWLDVLENHAPDLPLVLQTLRDLITGDATPSAVTGEGTEAAPWTLPLVAGVHVAIWRDSEGRLVIGIGFLKRVDDLGQRCMVLETRIRAAILAIDLMSGATSFLPELSLSGLGRARGGGRLTNDQGPLRFEVDHVAIQARYRPDAGLRVAFDAPNPALFVDGVRLPVDLRRLDGDLEDLIADLTREQWDAIERVIALLAGELQQLWAHDLIEALGWNRQAPVFGQPAPHRLALADLVADAEAAIRAWLARLLADGEAVLSSRLQPIARLLSGSADSAFHVAGQGTILDPWRVDLGTPGRPALAAWREPDAPLSLPNSLRSAVLRRWRPGRSGLEPGRLAEAIISEFPAIGGPFSRSLSDVDLSLGLLEIADRWQGTDGLVAPPPAPLPGTMLHLVENSTADTLLDGMDLPAILGTTPDTTIVIRMTAEDAEIDGTIDLASILDLRGAGRDPLAFPVLPAEAGAWHILLASRTNARLLSGDPDGVRGQVARLKHALSSIAARTGMTVVADAVSGHAAWLALSEMREDGVSAGARLVTVGLPVTADQAPSPLNSAAGEVMRRLAELLPEPDPDITDDPDLTHARKLLAMRQGDHASDLVDLALPAGWSATAGDGLDLHLVYGVYGGETVRRALTAIAAAGLSLHAQQRAMERPSRRITSASIGAWLPLSNAPAAGDLALEGQALIEFLGLDLELGSTPPSAMPRPERRFAAGLEIRRRDGWLIGGPATATRPLPLELRSLEIALRLQIGGGGTALDRLEIILHGVRLRGQSFPRLRLDPALPETALGIDGQASPTTPEIRQLLSQVISELVASGDAALAPIKAALRAAGILSADNAFDALSLSNWIDDPAGRLGDILSDALLRQELMALIGDLIGAQSGLTFDPTAGRLSIALSGSTGEPVLSEWALDAMVAASGGLGGSLRLGPASASHITITFAPFGITLGLGDEHRAAFGGLPQSFRLWPTPELARLGRLAPPTVAAAMIGRLVDEVRLANDDVQAIIDPALAIFDLLQPGTGGTRVVVPPLLFIDPGAWFRSDTVFGAAGGLTLRPDRAIAALDALRPLVGVDGANGVWQIEDGISLRARDIGGTLVLDLAIDTSTLLPGADMDVGGAFGLRFAADGRILPAIDLFVGLRGGASGTEAAHLTVAGSDIRLFLRLANGDDLEIYPNVAGLAQLGTAGLNAALPAVLDAIVDTGSDAGNLLADVGDALLLRTSGRFDGQALTDWTTDPAGTLETRWPALLTSGLNRLDDALPAGIGVSMPDGAIRIDIQNAGLPGSTIAVTLDPAPFSILLEANLRNLPFLETTTASLRFDTNGLARLNATIGPADLPIVNNIRLRPVVTLDIGNAVDRPFIAAGLAVDAANSNALLLHYDFKEAQFSLGFGNDTPAEIAAGIMHFAIDLIGSVILEIQEVEDLLATRIGSAPANGDLRSVLEGVILLPGNGGLDAEFFRILRNPGETADQLRDSKVRRLVTLIANIADLSPSVTVGNELDIGLARTAGGVLEFTLGLANRLPIATGDIAVWLENDSRWIIGGPAAGLKLGLIRLTQNGVAFEPSLSIDGLGLRIGRQNAPLLDEPLALGSIAFHVFARLSQNERLGGAQVQLSDIAAPLGGGQGEGDNPVAEEMLAETNSGDASLAPAFSPALSIQTRPADQGGGLAFRFAAGEGEGPWWLPIRKQFGPIYIDQIGLGAQEQNNALTSISLLFDGNVSIAGLQAAVDDLSLTYLLDRGDIFDSRSWRVDLAGLAVSADLSGVTLAGGLRKFTDPNIEYVGMLSARFSTYGLSIYGGYASDRDARGDFSAFFAYGSMLGPFGGPPAFFLTGIGGGFGINREVAPPTDLGAFDDFIMIAALDPAYQPEPDLIDEIRKVRNSFPVRRDQFWFAAGISFTSFALVDGIAVVAVEFGDGFELSIFGLARMALPRPEVALVSIELGLVARFSTEEGVIWVQAQLTDNSWLFHPSARLTGGFAFVSWFKGPNEGEFVLTLGGYHPSFHRDGYPVVPRLGFNWRINNNIVIKAESYFALTSEAIMAGGLFEASATFGPAYAHLSFGGNAIVYFDPFKYEADAHARVSAGIRIGTLFGTINLSFTLGTAVVVRGPEFHGRARVQVGPIDITVPFGDPTPVPAPLLSWVEFSSKYLELASNHQAEALSAIAGRGALPPASSTGDENGTADGSAAHPFDVSSEFELSITTTIPISHTERPGEGEESMGVSRSLGLAPMRRAIDKSVLRFSLRDSAGREQLDDTQRIEKTERRNGAFPIGVWGLAPDADDKKVPKGEVIQAAEGVDFRFSPAFNDPIGPFSHHQLESDERKPLPFKAAGRIRARLVREARDQRDILQEIDADRMPGIARDFGIARQSATAKRAWHRERPVPIRIGLLSERIVGSSQLGRKSPVSIDKGPKSKVTFGQARMRGLMTQTVRVAGSRTISAETTVGGALAVDADVARINPERLDEVIGAAGSRFAATLIRSGVEPPVEATTVVARKVQPETRAAVSKRSASAGRTGFADQARIDGITSMMLGRQRRSGMAAPQSLTPGEIAVFDLPGDTVSPRFETSGLLKLDGEARLVVIGPDGRIARNQFPATSENRLPRLARSFVVIAGAEAGDGEMAGWLGGSDVAYLGHALARCRGGFIRADGASRSRGGRRAGSGWMTAADLTDQSPLITTEFDQAATCVALLLDGAVTEVELATMALTMTGAEITEAKPLLVPYDGKTLIVYALENADRKGFSVGLGGLTAGRVDGVIAARLAPERLVARFLGETVDLDLETEASQRSGEVRAVWQAPADLDPAE